jgi:ribonuclease VapC
VAIQLAEPEADQFLGMLRSTDACIGGPTMFEYHLVMARRYGDEAGRLAFELIDALEIAVAPWTINHARAAADAHRRYGKGRHPAALNYGDCMAYALASLHEAPLLYKGDDFARTDILTATAL